MKKILLALTFAVAFIACEKIESVNTSDVSKDCIVSIVPKCEVSTSENPMTKAATLSNDLYAVQVYRGEERFAFGFFDNPSKMKLNLKQGEDYSILICLVMNAKTMLGGKYNAINGGISGMNGGNPFSSSSSLYIYDYYYRTNYFYYNNNGWLEYYYKNELTPRRKDGNVGYISNIKSGYFFEKYPTCTDWFYGEINDYTPTGEYSTMEFPLKRTGFKLKYELSGVTDGKVTVKVYNSGRTFIENTTSSKSYESDIQFIAFNDTYSAWKYADNYTENLTVAVTWVRGTGITQDLGTKTIQVKRNCLNNIRIRLSSDDSGSSIKFTTEDENSIGSAESDIAVKP